MITLHPGLQMHDKRAHAIACGCYMCSERQPSHAGLTCPPAALAVLTGYISNIFAPAHRQRQQLSRLPGHQVHISHCTNRKRDPLDALNVQAT
jgi:hypothetical protein